MYGGGFMFPLGLGSGVPPYRPQAVLGMYPMNESITYIMFSRLLYPLRKLFDQAKIPGSWSAAC